MCAVITLAHRRVVGRIARKYVDTVIRFSWLSRKMRQNHKYHYTEHLFGCQEKMRTIFRGFSIVGIHRQFSLERTKMRLEVS